MDIVQKIRNMSKKEFIWFAQICCMVIIVLDTAYWGGINFALVRAVIGSWMFLKVMYCVLFHSKCVAENK